MNFNIQYTAIYGSKKYEADLLEARVPFGGALMLAPFTDCMFLPPVTCSNPSRILFECRAQIIAVGSSQVQGKRFLEIDLSRVGSLLTTAICATTAVSRIVVASRCSIIPASEAVAAVARDWTTAPIGAVCGIAMIRVVGVAIAVRIAPVGIAVVVVVVAVSRHDSFV